MLCNVLVTVTVVSHGRVNMGIPLYIVYDLFLENRFQHYSSCAALLQFAEVFNVRSKTAAARYDGAANLHAEIFCFRVHCLLFFSI